MSKLDPKNFMRQKQLAGEEELLESLQKEDRSFLPVLKEVAQFKLPVPTAIRKLERFDWPIDITNVSISEVRGLMSYYTAHFSYLLVTIAKVKYLLSEVESDIRTRTRIIRAQGSKNKMKVAEISGLVEEDTKLENLEKMRLKIQGLSDYLSALERSYQQYINTSSRELSVRENEMRFSR